MTKVQVFTNFRTLDSMKNCVGSIVAVILLLSASPLMGQKGFNFSFSSGYRIGFSNSTPQNGELASISPLVDYGKGFYASLGCGYTTKKAIEFGGLFTYHQSRTEIVYDLPESYSTLKLKANTISVTPYIRLRKSLKGPFIPYIHLGVPLTFAEVLNISTSTTKDGKRGYGQDYYPRKIAIGINGGFGFYTVYNNNWQLFFEANFIGLNLSPDKKFFYSYSTDNPINKGEMILNTKEQKDENGNTLRLPFSNVGFGFGIRYNLSKMVENL